MSPEVRNFVEVEKNKFLQSKNKKISVLDILKNHNHEIWRVCFNCGESFDARKEFYYDRCPKCNSKNVK